MYRFPKVHMNILKIEHIYKTNQTRDTPNYKVLLRWGRYGVLMCKVIIALCSSLGILICISPIIFYVLWGEKLVPMVPIMLPGVNEKEQLGYTITTGYHFCMLALAMFGTAGADIMMISFILHMWPMCLILTNMLTDMNEAVMDPANRDSLKLKLFVRNMIMVHQELCM